MAAGLLEGKPDVIHPIMHWTLTKLSELKKRAYLANFLMTIEVPPEMLQNDEVTETREQVCTFITISGVGVFSFLFFFFAFSNYLWFADRNPPTTSALSLSYSYFPVLCDLKIFWFSTRGKCLIQITVFYFVCFFVSSLL